MTDHKPGLDMCISPDICASAISFGSVFVSRYSASVFFPLVSNKSSTPFCRFSTFVNISCMSNTGMPSRANLFLYSSCPCSNNTLFTISRISEPVRYVV